MKLILKSLAILLAGALLGSQAMAAVAKVIVVDDATPVAGVPVTLYTSDGRYAGITNDAGQFTAEIPGEFFRVRIGETVTGVYNAASGPAVIQLRKN
jgi:hypothetical protein